MLNYTEYEHILGMQTDASEYDIQKKSTCFFQYSFQLVIYTQKESCKEDKKKWISIIKKKKYVRTDRNTRSEEIFPLLDEVNSDQEEDIENLMNDSYTEFIVDENLDNDIDSDDEPLSVLIREAKFML